MTTALQRAKMTNKKNKVYYMYILFVINVHKEDTNHFFQFKNVNLPLTFDLHRSPPSPLLIDDVGQMLTFSRRRRSFFYDDLFTRARARTPLTSQQPQPLTRDLLKQLLSSLAVSRTGMTFKIKKRMLTC